MLLFIVGVPVLLIFAEGSGAWLPGGLFVLAMSASTGGLWYVLLLNLLHTTGPTQARPAP